MELCEKLAKAEADMNKTPSTESDESREPGKISEFKCDFCNATFETEEALRKHELTCTGEEIQPGL